MPELAALGPATANSPLADWPASRRRGWLLLIAIVALVHLLTVDWLVEDRFGWGQGERAPPRIEVAFVRELAQAEAPAAAPRRAAAVPARRARPVPAAASAAAAASMASAASVASAASAASAPLAPDSQAEVAAASAPAPAEPLPLAAASTPAAAASPAMAAAEAPAPAPATPAPSTPAVAAASPAVAASAAPAFEWPPSTRLSYALTGHYRGPVEGRAQVDWLRSGERYQVHLETSIGPVLSRHITSEGELTERGLAPRRFDGEQKVMLRAPRRWTQLFGPERVTLADGQQVDSQPGVQDEASQFVQLTWLFTTQPHLLQVGRSVEMPLALNRRIDRWIFEVVGEETLRLPFGDVPTLHVKPRRDARARDMVAEIWFAPTLQYLPVRILIRQEPDSWIDLSLEKPPLQASR